MSIQLGGLATGLDTNSLISQLLKVERKPIERLERDRSFFKARLAAFTDLDKRLRDLMSKAEELTTARKLVANKATPATEEFFKVSASSTAMAGNYNIKVLSLAQREKEVSLGVASVGAKEFGAGTLSLQVGGKDPVVINIDENNNSLGGIRDAINASGAGVKAAIINDGDAANPYRLVVTADDSGTPIEISANLSGGGYVDDPDRPFAFTQTQEGTRAHIQVDGIDIYRTSNTITEAIPGVTIDLLKEHGAADAATGLQVDLDVDAVEKKIRDFTTAYNEIVSFVAKQKDASWGRDAGMQAPLRNLQLLVSTAIGGDNSLQALSQLGMQTQKDGTLKVDGTRLKDAIRNDLDGVLGLFNGSVGVDGLAKKFGDYLKGVTDRANGILASRKTATDSSLRRIDQQIERQEMRLEKREKTMRAQFSAMEDLVGTLGAASSYLAQQLSMLSNFGSRR